MKASRFELSLNWITSIFGTLAQWAVSPLWQLRSLLPAKAWRRSTSLKPTAYLDGLRGFAALLVYVLHHVGWAHDGLKSASIFENAFGYNRQYYFACLPGIRSLFSGGHLSVAIFFVISGYVLSAKPLSLLHEGEFTKLGDNLASALFRRWLRLYIPIITTTFIYMMLNYLIRGLSTHKPAPRFFDEVFNWYAEFKNFSFIFRGGGEPWFTYNFHAWTIPYEFQGSIVVWTALQAFSRCTKNARLCCQLGLIFYFLYIVDGWHCSLFVAGMLLCDLDLLAEANDLPVFLTRLESYKDIIFTTLFIVGLYLGGVPSYNNDLEILRASPGWYYLSFLKPQAVFMYKAFYLFWASVFIMAAVPRISWLRSFFETPFCQYLGHISYGFYLAHGPVLWTIGDRVYAAVGWARETHAINMPGWANVFRLPKAGPFGLEISFLAANVFLLPITIWAGKMVTVLFDEPSNRFSRWAYKKAVTPSPDTKGLVTWSNP